MKKSYLLITVLFFSLLSNSQTKIASNTFLYGDLKNSINDNILIWYGIDDPKGELQAVDIFISSGFNVINYSSLFLPGQNYTASEETNQFNKNNIKTIILIKRVNTSTSEMSFANSSYSSLTKSVYTNASSGQVIGQVFLNFEIYSTNSGFDKPFAIIKSHATNNWGIGGTERGVIKTILKNVSKGINEYK